MKNIFALFLIAGLLLGGCAKKAAMDEPAVAPVAEQAPPAAAEQAPPVVVEEAKAAEPVAVPVVEVQKAVEPAAMKIFFDFDSSLLTTGSKEALQGNALWLQAQPEVRIRIEGHTDERGSSSYNLALGERRAQAARNFLLTLGVAEKRVTIISYGEEKAASAANDETLWAQDRRAEFIKTN
jgi:peptidoglycan-associated lipoprotein